MQRKKKKAAFNLSDSLKQHSSPQSKAPMDKFGTVMRSRYALFRKTIQESLDAESSDGNQSWPGDATSSDSWRFCIAWFSNCYGNEHHRMQNRAILLQCDRPLRISFIQWGINEAITKLSWKFEENRTSGRFYFFKQRKEHNKWNPRYNLSLVLFFTLSLHTHSGLNTVLYLYSSEELHFACPRLVGSVLFRFDSRWKIRRLSWKEWHFYK